MLLDVGVARTTPSSPNLSTFEQFWSAYPRKKEKLAAERAYSKALKMSSPEAILAGLEAYKREIRGTAPKYVKYPASWLNAGCWMDEPSSTKTTGAISPSRSEWVCRHTPHCGNRTTCAVVASRHCEHEPLCQSREACMTRTLEGWQ